MNELTHTDDQGKANMVDVGGKPDQQRMARASGMIYLQAETIRLIRENQMKKGDVLRLEITGYAFDKDQISSILLKPVGTPYYIIIRYRYVRSSFKWF